MCYIMKQSGLSVEGCLPACARKIKVLYIKGNNVAVATLAVLSSGLKHFNVFILLKYELHKHQDLELYLYMLKQHNFFYYFLFFLHMQHLLFSQHFLNVIAHSFLFFSASSSLQQQYTEPLQ